MSERHRESKGYPENDHDRSRPNRSRKRRTKRKRTKRPRRNVFRVSLCRAISSRSAKSRALTRRHERVSFATRKRKSPDWSPEIMVSLTWTNEQRMTSRRKKPSVKRFQFQIKTSYSDALTRPCYATREATVFKQIVQHPCQAGHLLRVMRTLSFLRVAFN